MRVSVVINSKAGSVDQNLLERKIRDALFRCDLHFCIPKSFDEMCLYLQDELNKKTDALLIAGGDGTINACIQFLMKHQSDWSQLPPIALVKSGTANDLASEIGVSSRIDRAARSIIEGQVKKIDIIEVEGDGQVAYMLTNGGIGIPAETAQLANQFRDHLRKISTCPKTKKIFKDFAGLGYKTVRSLGSGVYSLMIAEALRKWDQNSWALDISIPGKLNIETSAPIVLINNQARLGSSFLPAPFTSNSDGTVNLLLAESKNVFEHLHAALQIKSGKVGRGSKFQSFELKEFSLKARNSERALTFFGDGEILLKDVSSITVRCLAKGLPVVVAG